MKYEQLQQEGAEFLAHCGEFALIDNAAPFSVHPDSRISANEMLGMAVRVVAEQAKVIQQIADEEEINE